MNIDLLISIAVAIKFPTLTDVDSMLSILEHLIVIATTIIASLIRYEN